jgi:DnaJ-class molecular chaperone
VVSKAFQVLSDSTLRAAFDRDGGDPESRFGSGMRSSGTGTPNDLYNNLKADQRYTQGEAPSINPADLKES